MRKNYPLSSEEREFIKKNVGKKTIGEIAAAIGRNYYTVWGITKSLGHNPIHVWTRDEDEKMLSMWGRYSAKYIAGKLGVQTSSVYNRMRRLRKNGKVS